MEILLTNDQCPGDCLVMTAAVESLHLQFPGQYRVAVRTSCDQLFDHNPHIFPVTSPKEIRMENRLIHKAHLPFHFLQSYTDWLGCQLDIPLTLQVNRPYLYLSDEEKSWTNQVEELTGYKGSFWLVNAGYKNDYTVKKWRHTFFQEVVNHFHGKIQFVQVGSPEHNHKPLDKVINLVGKTDTRQLVRLAYHAQGAVSPESFLHHLMAAFEKPCVTLCSGFLPTSWIWYKTAKILTSYLPCSGGCWCARVVPMNDQDEKDKSLCKLPVVIFPNGEYDEDPTAKCMTLITPQDAIRAIEGFMPR